LYLSGRGYVKSALLLLIQHIPDSLCKAFQKDGFHEEFVDSKSINLLFRHLFAETCTKDNRDIRTQDL